MAEKPASPFGEWLEKNRGRYPALNQPAQKPIDFSKMTAVGNEGAGDKPSDFLSSFFDIISRPLFAVTETADSALDAVAKGEQAGKKFQSGDILGGIGDTAGIAGEMLSAPVRGFFSTDRADKRTTSELIEKTTDVIGKRSSPEYEDVQDNVNPWVKSIAGFAGDVGLDPLTYIPGVAIAKGIGAAVKGIKGLTGKGAKAAEESTEGAEEAAQEAAELQMQALPEDAFASWQASAQPRLASDGSFMGKPAAEGPQNLAQQARSAGRQQTAQARQAIGLGDDLQLPAQRAAAAQGALGLGKPLALPVNVTEQARKALGLGDDLPPLRGAGKETKAQKQARIQSEVDSAKSTTPLTAVAEAIAKAAPKIEPEAASAVDEVAAALKTTAEVVQQAPAVKPEAVKSLGQLVQESPKRASVVEFLTKLAPGERRALSAEATTAKPLSPKEWREQILKATDEDAAYADGLKPAPGRAPIEDELATAAIFPKDPKSLPVLNRAYGEYKAKAEAALAGGKLLDALGRVTDAPTATEATIESALDRFTALVANEQGLGDVEQLLGTALTSRLRAMSNPDTFDEKMLQLKTVMEQTGLLNSPDIVAATPLLGDALKALSIRNPAKAAELARANAVVTNAVEEAAQETAEGTKRNLADTIERMKVEDDLTLTEKDALAGLTETLRTNTNLADLVERQGMVLKSDGGTMRNAEKMGVGEGRDLHYANTFFQFDLYKTIQMRAVARAKKDKLFGLAKAARVERETLEAMDFAEQTLLKNGYPLHFSAGTERIPMTFSQVYRVLAAAGKPTSYKKVDGSFYGSGELLMRLLMNNPAQGGVPSTNLMQAVVALLKRGDIEEVATKLASVKKENGKTGGKELRNFFEGASDIGADPKTFRYWHRTFNERRNNKKTPPTEKLPFGGEWVPNPNGKGYYATMSSTNMFGEFLEILTDSSDALRQLAAKNEAAYLKKYKRDTLDILDTDMSKLNALVESGEIGSAIRAAAGLGKSAKKTGKAKGADPAAIKTAEMLEEAQLPASMKADLRASVAAADLLAKGDKKGAARVAQKRFEERVKEVKNLDEEIMRAGLAGDDPDLVKVAAGRAWQAAVRDSRDRVTPSFRAADEAAQAATAARANKLDDTTDIASREAYAGINAGRLSLFEGLGTAFRGDYGLRGKLDIYHMYHASGILMRTLMSQQDAGLRKLAKKFGGAVEGTDTTQLQAAMRALQQRGAVPKGNAAVAEVHGELRKYMSKLWDLNGKEPVLGNAFFRNNPLGIDYLNRIFTSYKVLGDKTPADGIFLDVAKAEKEITDLKALGMVRGRDGKMVDAFEDRGGYLGVVFDQWRDWDIDDPLDFLRRLNNATLQMGTDVGVAQSFVRMAKDAGLTSATPKAGYARIVAEGESKYAELIHHFGGQNLYYDKEILRMMARLDAVVRESKSVGGEGSGFSKFITEVFDPLLNAWKYAITLPRPGHHIRNAVGDGSMTFVALGIRYYAKAGNDAFRVMSLRNEYDGVDIVRALNTLGINELPKGGSIISSGKYGDITSKGIIDAAMRGGFLPPARIVEDIYDEPGKLKNLLDKGTVRGGKVENAVSNISEYRDHYFRLQHFIQFIHQAQRSGKYKNVDEMLAAASNDVLKWHPDVSLLSNFETKYMRRIIPFYSWLRGAVPAIAEAIVLNPARVNAFNKASYNIAVASGVNPESLYDPFPEDQMFPSFLTEQVEGPQFKIGDDYFRVNPGLAPWDVMNMLGPDPVRGIMGSTNPLVRVPAEMLAGGAWGTGARINDQSDYLDGSIPGVNYLSNWTGTSVTGSIASLLQGRGFDPQYQHAAGNKDGMDSAVSALNFVTGLGLQNYSKPNYINYAEIEKRNQEGEQRGF